MDEVWTVAPAGAGRHEVTVRAAPRPLVARLTDAELAEVEHILRAIRRDEFSRIQLGAAFREAIGRDPFRQQRPPGRSAADGSWWAELAALVFALGFAAEDHALWLRIVAYLVAAVSAAALAGRVVRRARRA